MTPFAGRVPSIVKYRQKLPARLRVAGNGELPLVDELVEQRRWASPSIAKYRKAP